MIRLRPAHDRGMTQIDWLDSRHTFSFGSYFNESQMGYRSLRVINDDRVAPGAGFGMHGHKNMEIITLVLEGELRHADSLGNGSNLTPGEVQVMTAGTGIRHSEFNPSPNLPVHFLQIWVEPAQSGLAPSYSQARLPSEAGGLALVAHPADPAAPARIHQDAILYAGQLKAAQSLSYPLAAGRGVWVHVIDGELNVEGNDLRPGDGLAAEDEPALALTAKDSPVSFLLFDLA